MKPVDNRAECKEVINTVNNILEENRQGRVFAIVHLCGKQFKVTAGDLVLVEGYWQPTIGDQIKLEKVDKHGISIQCGIFYIIIYCLL